eukprot:5155355-Amphidinium_carterae.1
MVNNIHARNSKPPCTIFSAILTGGCNSRHSKVASYGGAPLPCIASWRRLLSAKAVQKASSLEPTRTLIGDRFNVCATFTPGRGREIKRAIQHIGPLRGIGTYASSQTHIFSKRLASNGATTVRYS